MDLRISCRNSVKSPPPFPLETLEISKAPCMFPKAVILYIINKWLFSVYTCFSAGFATARLQKSVCVVRNREKMSAWQAERTVGMNVLLIGSGPVAEALVDKLNKCGDRIYVLTGRRERYETRKRVFERYHFTYDDDSVQDVFESVKPEATIFLGNWDANFNWRDPRKESVRYTAAVMNLLAAWSIAGRGRFVYLSSHEVYGGSYPNNVPESRTPSPRGFRAMAVAQGEEICANYRRTQNLDVVILRFDHLYGIPRRERGGQSGGPMEEGPCFAMCLEALQTGHISASSREVFSMIFLKDAVELVYKAVSAKKLQRPLYHISSMEEVNGIQLAEILRGAIGGGIDIRDNTVGDYHRVVLDGGAFQKEFGQKILVGVQDGAEQVARYMRRHAAAFLQTEDVGGGRLERAWHVAKSVLIRLVPFVESLICFLLVYRFSGTAAASDFFARVDFYLVYVLLFALLHGQQQAVLAAFLSLLGYCAGQMGTRTGFEVLLDYNTYVWMAQLFILGMAVGYLKDRLRLQKQEDAEEIDYLREKLADIADINDSNVRMKKNFEVQLVNQKGSLGKIYEITSQLEGYAPEEVLFYAAQVLSQLMDCRDVAVYFVANGDYARLFSATSAQARSLGTSIKYTDMPEMYSQLKERRVYINKNMAENLPLMASAVYAEEGMQLIFMLWGIPWQRMTLAEANRLAVVGQLVQSAVVRANRYLEALRSQRYVGGSNLLAEDAFSQLVKAFLEARDKGLTQCTLLEIVTHGEGLEEVAAHLSHSIRQTDYMGLFQGGKLCVLLSNTDQAYASGVMERFRQAGYESRLVKGALS